MRENVILNLLSNALKFTCEGEITVAIRQTEGIAALVIRDAGTGVPAAEMPRLFERFYRVENAKARMMRTAESAWHWCQSCSSCTAASLQLKAFWGPERRSVPARLWGRGTCPPTRSDKTARHGCRFGRRRTVARPRRSHACTLRGAQRFAGSCFHGAY